VFRAGGHWLRQATVLGLGVGLLAGTGLIATASAASAHPDAARASSGHRPAQRCVVIVGRRHRLRVQPRSCLSPVPAAVARCHIKLQQLRGRTAPPKAVRLGRPPRPGRLQVKVPVAVRLSACPPVQVIRPVQVKVCRAERPQRAKSAARCCTATAPRLRLVRPQRLLRRGRAQAPVFRLRAPAAVRAQAPVRACVIVAPARLRPAPRR
jgi:hypothetical protein